MSGLSETEREELAEEIWTQLERIPEAHAEQPQELAGAKAALRIAHAQIDGDPAISLRYLTVAANELLSLLDKRNALFY